MADLIRIPLDGGGSILVEEAYPGASGPVRVGRAGDVVRDATATLQTALQPVRETAEGVLAELGKARPDELEVEFGVCLTAEVDAVIARTEAVAHLKVTLRWARNGEPGAGA